MTTALSELLFRGDRRVRLFFTGALAAGAYTSTALYAVACDDGGGASSINVVAVFAVVGTPSAVELAVDEDWGGGALYTVTCTAVPCADSSTFTGSLDARVGLPLTTPVNAEPATNDIDLLLYGRDLLHDGTDFVLDSTGDLGTTSGRENYRGAMGRRMASNGLPWDDTYGGKGEEYVDAPEAQSLPFAGNLLSQARMDDRTKQAAVEIVQSDEDPGDWAFEMTLTAQDGLDDITLTVPLPGS